MIRTSMLAFLAVSALAVSHGAAADDDAAGEDAELARIRGIVLSRGDDPAAPAQLVQLTRDLKPAVAAEVFEQVAAAHVAAGRIDAAAEYRELLIATYPDQPPVGSATLWLMRLLCSSEVAHAGDNAPQDPAARRVDPASAFAALHLASKATAEQSALADNPALTFQRAVAERHRGRAKAALGLLTPLKHGRGEPWRRRALVETWLDERRQSDHVSPPPLAVMNALPVRTPPHLDGALDELSWRTAASVAIDDGATLRLAYDADYLYLAVDAAKRSGVAYPTDAGPRPQDGAGDSHDRVTLRLDMDRDYATCYELTVDSRGWTADAVFGDARWNPQWFVAADDDARRWRIEAALPWSELTAIPPTSGEAWAARVERLAPGEEASGSDYHLLLLD